MKLNAELVRKEIKKTGRTLEQFCSDIDIKNYNLSKYLGGANIPERVARRIADELQLDIFEIIELGFHY